MGRLITRREGHMLRAVPSLDFYRHAFIEHTERFKIMPFEAQIGSDPDQKFLVEAEGSIDIGPGRVGAGKWLANVRDGRPYGYTFKKNAASGYQKPVHRGFLVVSALATSDRREYARFKDNPVFFTNAISDLMKELSWGSYNANSEPFALLHINITSLTPLDGTKMRMVDLSRILQRRADFTFCNREQTRELMKLCCRNADPVDIIRIRPIIEQYFPVKEEGWINLLTEEGGRSTKRFVVLNAKTGEKVTSEPIAPGESLLFSVWDSQENKWCDLSELALDSISGASIMSKRIEDVTSAYLAVSATAEQVANNLEQQYAAGLKVFICKLHKLGRLDPDTGRLTVISRDEYDVDDLYCVPRRMIYIRAKGERSRLCVVDVPYEPHESTAGGRPQSQKTNKNGSGRNGKNNLSKVGDKSQMYCDRDEWFLGEFDHTLSLWQYNQNHPWVAKNHYTQENEFVKDRLRDIYDYFCGLARDIYQGNSCVIREKSPPGIPVTAEDELIEDQYDAPMNIVLSRQLHSPMVKVKLEEIEKHLLRYGT